MSTEDILNKARNDWLNAKKAFMDRRGMEMDKVLALSKREIQMWSRYSRLRTGVQSTNPDYR